MWKNTGVSVSDRKNLKFSDITNILSIDKKIIKDERLRECNYGELNGKDSKLIEYADHIDEPFPGGEALLTVEKRVCI